MKLFNYVLALTIAAIPAVAVANNQGDAKHGNVKSIFVTNADDGFLKSLSKHQVGLEDHYLSGTTNKFSSNSKPENLERFSEGSFQSKIYSDYKHSEDKNGLGNHKDLSEWNSSYFSHDTRDHEESHFGMVGLDEHFKNLDRNHHEWENHPACTPVPEPTTYALMLSGLLMLGFSKRRKS